MADHLLELGHRRIGIVAIGAPHEPYIRARASTFQETLAAHGCAIDTACWQWAEGRLDDGYAAAHRLLALPEPPTTIYATNDLMAIGAMAWLALVSTPTVPYAELVIPFVMAGSGMAMVFAPAANAVLSSVRSTCMMLPRKSRSDALKLDWPST